MRAQMARKVERYTESREIPEGIDENTRQFIAFKAYQVTCKYGFAPCERRIIEHDLMSELVIRLPRYDSQRARLSTFISMVVNNRAAELVNARRSSNGRYRRHVLSLDEQVPCRNGGSLERMDTINEDDFLLSTERISRPQDELMELARDVRAVLDKLPDDLRHLCERLTTDTVADVCADTGAPRGKIRFAIQKIRDLFEEAGLQDYYPNT
jgi:RNA polymerase sigma-70 factor (ECF subfamily)